MKLVNLTLGIITAGTIFVISCSAANNILSEEEIGLRKTDIYTEDKTVADKTEYSKDVPGTSKKIKRAFQDAPPMIPHDVEGMIPITIDNNQCTMCHEPAMAQSMGATPIPKSHFIDFRPKHHYNGKKFEKAIDNMKNETSVKPIPQLAGARFNCTQCHAPQSQGALAVENTFEANFTKKDGEFKSSWDEVILEDLDTVKKDK